MQKNIARSAPLKRHLQLAGTQHLCIGNVISWAVVLVYGYCSRGMSGRQLKFLQKGRKVFFCLRYAYTSGRRMASLFAAKFFHSLF
jgi:hypothetical protein